MLRKKKRLKNSQYFCAAKKLQELFTGLRAQRVAGAGLNCCVYPRFALMCLFVLAALQSARSLVGETV